MDLKNSKVVYHFYDIIKDKKKLIPVTLYIVTLAICFLIFQQGDLFHTSTSSYAYLEGHFLDFYDYNKPIVKQNDYYALMYIIFAIWNIPLKVFGLMHDTTAFGLTLTPIELFWTKLLLVTFYFGTTYIIYKISELIITSRQKSAKLISIIFATSPIAIFCVFIFGQYDIIGLFFTMVGLYYYLKGNYTKFSIAFSLAISLKFFAVILFIPLILLSNKKILQIIKYGIIGILATVIQIAMYIGNEAFRGEFFSLAGGKLDALKTFDLSLVNNSPYLIIIFCIICIYAYIKIPNNQDENNRISIFICLISYSILFSTVIWHPQWLIIIMPFFALSYIYVNDVEKMYLIDIVGMFSYVYIVVNIWPNHVDVAMVNNGILRSLFTYIPLLNKDIFIGKFLFIFEGIFFVYLFSPILVYCFEKYNKTANTFSNNKNYFYSRLFIGIGIFVIPSLICAMAPRSLAIKINPNAYSIENVISEASEQVTGPIDSNVKVVQSFTSHSDLLKKVEIKLATYGRKNKCTITLALYDGNMKLIESQKINGETLVDSKYYSFNFKPIIDSANKKYYFEITADGDINNGIATFRTNADVYPEGECKINEEVKSGDLNMKFYYDIPNK